MDFKVDRKLFLSVLDTAKKVIGKKNRSLPILNNIRIRAGRDVITVRATDLAINCVQEIRGSVSQPGEVLLNLFDLHSFVKSCKGEEMKVTKTDEIEGNRPRVFVECWKAKAWYVSDNMELYPEVSDFDVCPDHGVKWHPDKVSEMLSSVIHACAKNDPRASLNGIYFSAYGSCLRAAATNRTVLSVYEGDLPYASSPIIVPEKACSLLAGMTNKAEYMRLEFEGGVEKEREDERRGAFYVDFANRSLKMVFRGIKGGFPDYNLIIPNGESFQVNFSSEILCEALAEIKADDCYNAVKMVFCQSSCEMSGGKDGIETSTTVPCDYSGENFIISLSKVYLLGVIGKSQGQVTLKFSFDAEEKREDEDQEVLSEDVLNEKKAMRLQQASVNPVVVSKDGSTCWSMICPIRYR